jgi:predicted transposase YbfD/YdcC
VATTSSKGRGRPERRTITTTTWLNAYLGDWPGVARVFRSERRRKMKGREEVAAVYGITSLSELAADANALSGYTRGHWGIASGLHHTRDVTPSEDRCRVRRGRAPRVPASLRNVAVYLLRDANYRTVAAATRAMVARPERALALLNHPDSISA